MTIDYSLNTRIHGAAGGSLASSGLDAANVAVGVSGEQKVAAALEEYLGLLLERNYDAEIYHGLKLPGYNYDHDHILRVGSALFVIDTKNWKRGQEYYITQEGDANVAVRRAIGSADPWQHFEGGDVHLPNYLTRLRSTEEFRRYTALRVYGLLVLSHDEAAIVAAPKGFVFTSLSGLVNSINGLMTHTTPELLSSDGYVPRVLSHWEVGRNTSYEEQFPELATSAQVAATPVTYAPVVLKRNVAGGFYALAVVATLFATLLSTLAGLWAMAGVTLLLLLVGTGLRKSAKKHALRQPKFFFAVNWVLLIAQVGFAALLWSNTVW